MMNHVWKFYPLLLPIRRPEPNIKYLLVFQIWDVHLDILHPMDNIPLNSSCTIHVVHVDDDNWDRAYKILYHTKDSLEF